MHKVVNLTELYPVIEEKLHNGGCITLTAYGTSMLPMLHHKRDSVILGPVNGMPKKNDVVLYRRENGNFVLHRIVGKEENGDYILCGDNQITLEHSIRQHQIVGILQAFIRNGHHIYCSSFSYKAYVCLLQALRLLRHGFHKGHRYLSAIKRWMHHQANGNR